MGTQRQSVRRGTADVLKVAAVLVLLLSISTYMGLYIALTTSHTASSEEDWISAPIRPQRHENGRSNHALHPAPLLWTDTSHSKQVEKKDKHGNILHHAITSLQANDLQGLSSIGGTSSNATTITLEDARRQGKEYTVQLLADAGIHDIAPAVLSQLPVWKDVASLYYSTQQGSDVTDKGPVILGLDTACTTFRERTPLDDASVAVAGLFNTGTNPAAMYLSANCYMPGNTNDKAGHGMRWQVPWGKHMLASRKWNNTAGHDGKVNKTNVLPVVLVRDPYTWMASMCRHPYAARWKHNSTNCPHLVVEDNERHAPNRVSIKYPKETLHWPTLLDLWIDWYSQYLDADFPRLMVRYVNDWLSCRLLHSFAADHRL